MTQKNAVYIVTTMITSNHILVGVWGQYWGEKTKQFLLVGDKRCSCISEPFQIYDRRQH